MELNKPISHLTLCPSKKSITITKEPTAHKKASHQQKNKEDKVGKGGACLLYRNPMHSRNAIQYIDESDKNRNTDNRGKVVRS
jgi:hypothetical protein